MHLLLLFCFSHLVLTLGPVEAFAYVSLLFFFHFFLYDFLQFNYPKIPVSFFFDRFHYFTIWELYSFTSNYFPSLNGKNSTLFHSKLHPNISTKNMSSSHKCINLIFTLGKQLHIIYVQQIILLVFLLS